MATLLKLHSIRDQVSPAEWAVRQDLACAYRMIAHLGWDDLNFTHLSARVPGEDAFLLNPWNLGFEEVTASSLLKLDFEGRPLIPNGMMLNPAGFTIHSSVLLGRADAGSVMHLHTIAGTAVSMMQCGLLPWSQAAASVTFELAYHDYEGIAVDLGERERLQAHLTDKNAMILRNHGTLTLGSTVAEAFGRLYFLERACQMQVAAMAAGGPDALVQPTVEAIETAANVTRTTGAMAAEKLVWPLLRRRMERLDPGFLN